MDKLTSVRQVAIWHRLQIPLTKIHNTLRDPDDFAVEDVELLPRESPKQRRSKWKAIKSAKFAIRRLKEFRLLTYHAEFLLKALPRTDWQQAVISNLGTWVDAIDQADIPAEMAIRDGYDLEAIEICENAIRRAAGCALTPFTEPWRPQLPKDLANEDFDVAVGMEYLEFIKLDNETFEEIVGSWPKECGTEPIRDTLLYSKFRPIAEWIKVLNHLGEDISEDTFLRRRTGVAVPGYRVNPESRRGALSLAIDDLPDGYSDSLRPR